MIKATLSFLSSMSCNAEMKMCSISSHAATPPFIRIIPLFTRTHLLWALPGSRCCLSLHHLLTSTTLWKLPDARQHTSWRRDLCLTRSSSSVRTLSRKCGSTSQLHIQTLTGSVRQNRGGCNRWLPRLLEDYCKWRYHLRKYSDTYFYLFVVFLLLSIFNPDS